MAECRCCCENLELPTSLFNNECGGIDIFIRYLEAAYVGNTCIDELVERVQIWGAGFWLYNMNPGIFGFPADETMFLPAPEYTSTFEDKFSDWWNCEFPDTDETEDKICDIQKKLYQAFGDACPPTTVYCEHCEDEQWDAAKQYILREYSTPAFGGPTYISLNSAPPIAVSPSDPASAGVWYPCKPVPDPSVCADCCKDPTYEYWWISALTRPDFNFRYEIWNVNGPAYIVDDRVVFNEEVWKALIPVGIGWANRPGAVLGQWEKLS